MLFTNTRQLEVADMSAAYLNIKINHCVFYRENAKLRRSFAKKDTTVNAWKMSAHISRTASRVL